MGGLPGIPNEHLVRSAIERPYSGYYPRIEQKAAALVESLACNHGFADGNKRTTLILTYLLLNRSGYDLRPLASAQSINDEIEAMILAVAEGKMPLENIVGWFKERIGKRSYP